MLDIRFGSFPVLTTERLRLRQPQPGDAGELFVLRTNESVMQYVDRPRPRHLGEVEELLELMRVNFEENKGINWMICPTGQDQTIGIIGLWRIEKENHRAEVGYMLHPDWQGRGIMQEALLAVLDYGFQVLNLHSVEANVNPQNLASIRLLEKCGFVQEALFRENYFFEGKFMDSAIFCILTPKGREETSPAGAPQ